MRRRRQVNAELALAFLGARSADEVRLTKVVDRHVKHVLDAADGNLSVAAELLGVNRRTMQRHARASRRRGRVA